MEDKNEDMSRKFKLITSMVICFGTFCMGLSFSLLGPSLVALAKQFETDIPTLSKVFVISIGCWVVGSLLAGVIYNYANRQLASTVLLIVMAIGTIILPLVPSISTFFITAAIVGLGFGGYDTAQVVWILEIWEGESAIYLQLQGFCFALGSFVSPLLMKIYLLDEESSELLPNQGQNATSVVNVSTKEDDVGFLREMPSYGIPFLIAGVMGILGAIFTLVLYKVKKYKKPNSKNSEIDTSQLERLKGCQPRTVLFIILCCCMLGSEIGGIEYVSFQFLPAYVQLIELHLSQRDGAFVLSVLAGAYTIGRALGIVVVLRVRPEILLLINLLCVGTANTLLIFFNHYLQVILVAAVFLGIGISTIFSAFFGYVEKHLEVTNLVGGILISMGCTLSTIYPIVVGDLIEKNPYVLNYTIYFSMTLATCAFVALHFVSSSRWKGSKNLHRYPLTQINSAYCTSE